MNNPKPYRPSNSDEGFYFMSCYCNQCIHEKWNHTQKDGDLKCEILSLTMALDTKDAEYPKEWIYDENNKPTCTSWKKWDWGSDDDGWNEPPEPDTDDPNQLCFPFILEEFGIDTIVTVKEIGNDISIYRRFNKINICS